MVPKRRLGQNRLCSLALKRRWKTTPATLSVLEYIMLVVLLEVVVGHNCKVISR